MFSTAGITYLIRYFVSITPLLSFFLSKNVLGVAEPNEVVTNPTIEQYTLFSYAVVETLIYHPVVDPVPRY